MTSSGNSGIERELAPNMKTKHIILNTAIFAFVMLLAVHVTCMALINRSPFSNLSKFSFRREKTYILNGQCGGGNSLQGLAESTDPQLSKLLQYQDVCGSMPATRTMLFTDMPNSETDAREKATKMAGTLKEFDRVKMAPLIIMEPVTAWGSIDFKEFRSGLYDSWIDTYFMTLKSEGVSDAQMGMWTPFPEANLPYWNHQNSKPDDFAVNVSKVVQAQKKYFPTSKASVMLNSATYENDDFDWATGDYTSLVPYLKDIPKGLIDSFGYQGLPWLPPATQSGVGVVDTNEYLNPKLAKEAADQLGVKEIWFNTGTFGAKYTLDDLKTIHPLPEQRKDLLAGVLVQAKKLKDDGYKVSINLFAQDKSATEEATDWSYWQSDPKTSPASIVFSDFARDVKANNMELWLFDRK